MFGGAWKPPIRNYTDNDGESPFNNEEPLPALDMSVFNSEDSIGDQAAESCSEEGGAEEYCETEAEFATGIEEG